MPHFIIFIRCMRYFMMNMDEIYVMWEACGIVEDSPFRKLMDLFLLKLKKSFGFPRFFCTPLCFILRKRKEST